MPWEHPSLSFTYANIASIHYQLYDYTSSIEYCEKAIENQQKSSTADHPVMAGIYNTMGITHKTMNNCSAALANFQKAIDSLQKSFPFDHPITVMIYLNIASTHCGLGDSLAGLLYCEKALKIHKECFSTDHPHAATIYLVIGGAHQKRGDHPVALSYYEKALKIQQKTLPSHHADLVTTFTSIAEIQKADKDILSAHANAENAILTLKALVSTNKQLVSESTDDQALENALLFNRSGARIEELHKQALSRHPSPSITTAELLEAVAATSNLMGSAENCFRVQPKSLLLRRKLFDKSFDGSDSDKHRTQDLLEIIAEAKS